MNLPDKNFLKKIFLQFNFYITNYARMFKIGNFKNASEIVSFQNLKSRIKDKIVIVITER